MIKIPVLPQAQALSRRAIFALARQPQSWLPGFLFPILLALVYKAQFSRVIEMDPPLVGFEGVTNFLDFILPASLLQGISFGATVGAGDLAVDIERGFFDRLLASPVNRLVILLGRMAGTVVWAVVQTVVVILIFLALGARIEGGFGIEGLGIFLVLILCAVLLGLFIGSFAMGLALRTGSEEVVQSIFPMIFAFLFLSAAFFPTEAMQGWYQWLAERNPITFIIEPLRRMVLTGFDVGDMLQAILVTSCMAALTLTFALSQLQKRLKKN